METRTDKFMRDVARHGPLGIDATSTGLLRLFNNAKYSDATILIHDVPLHAHKSVICIQSAYLQKAFLETFVEGSSGTLTFNEGSGAAHWGCLSTCTLATIRTICRTNLKAS